MHDIELEVVEAALEDPQTAPIDERLRGALLLLEVLTLRPWDVGPADMDRARAAGLSDLAIYEAMYVGFVFNVITRLADAFDFDVEDPKTMARAAGLLHRFGYGSGAIPA